MTGPVYDQQLVNNSDAAERCMKLGAVILKPPNQPTIGFAAPQSTAVDPERRSS